MWSLARVMLLAACENRTERLGGLRRDGRCVAGTRRDALSVSGQLGQGWLGQRDPGPWPWTLECNTVLDTRLGNTASIKDSSTL
jgi:hypothetical protein